MEYSCQRSGVCVCVGMLYAKVIMLMRKVDNGLHKAIDATTDNNWSHSNSRFSFSEGRCGTANTKMKVFL